MTPISTETLSKLEIGAMTLGNFRALYQKQTCSRTC